MTLNRFALWRCGIMGFGFWHFCLRIYPSLAGIGAAHCLMFLEPGGEVAGETRASCEKMAEVSFAWELSSHPGRGCVLGIRLHVVLVRPTVSNY